MKFLFLYAITLFFGSLAVNGTELRWESNVRGVAYLSKTTKQQIIDACRKNPLEAKRSRSFASEYKGTVGLVKAIELGDVKAKEILGKDYTELNGIWLLSKATRNNTYQPSIIGGEFYRLVYNTRTDMSDVEGAGGELIVIVLFDGTVLPIEEVKDQK